MKPAKIVLVALALSLCSAGCAATSAQSPPPTSQPGSTPRASTTSPTTPAAADAAPLAWSDCRSTFATGGDLDTFTGAVECATMTVPLDWASPQGATTTVAVVRMRSSTRHERIGSMVFNPGGPGAAGVIDLTSNWTKFGLPLADRFDLVGFDPRGVGSSNQVSCISDADKIALVSLPTAIADALPVLSRIADGCTAANADPLIARMGTMAVVHDLDALRTALGDDQLTFFGYSYGSEIAAGYAATYPDRVRALVGDGAIDVYGTQADGARFSAAGTERGLQKAAALCAADPPCSALITDPLAVLDAELARAATSTPIVTAGRAVTPVTIGLASYVSVSRLSTLPVFFQALLDLRDRGDGTLMLGLADAFVGGDGAGHYDRRFDSYLSVTCADQADRPTAADLTALQTEMTANSPRSGQGLALFAAACTGWPAPPKQRPAQPRR